MQRAERRRQAREQLGVRHLEHRVEPLVERRHDHAVVVDAVREVDALGDVALELPPEVGADHLHRVGSRLLRSLQIVPEQPIESRRFVGDGSLGRVARGGGRLGGLRLRPGGGAGGEAGLDALRGGGAAPHQGSRAMDKLGGLPVRRQGRETLTSLMVRAVKR